MGTWVGGWGVNRDGWGINRDRRRKQECRSSQTVGGRNAWSRRQAAAGRVAWHALVGLGAP